MKKLTPQLVGNVYGRLTVTAQGEPTSAGKRRWLCRCMCGSVLSVRENSLLTGGSKSCGCKRWETIAIVCRRHGQYANSKASKTLLAWKNMRSRCENPKNEKFMYYGAEE